MKLTYVDVGDEKQLLELINKIASDMANIYLKTIKAEFPKIWGQSSDGRFGSDVSDPLTIFLVDEEGDEVYAEISLSDALMSAIEQCEEDGSFALGLTQISARMKDLASRIDATCEKHEN